ncbi:hypothetical protein E1A91_A02G138500v1 [Gossypium mustelinum]|uniref:Uncharacterized protein n=1 Tax=Gossypium mustelinum TaxID=34275 RepID=A0A5D3A9X9_GOSMU|nr:hypothetical protein E1A91_A02G138500v1 [Gossypium mustelinum]
MAFSFIALNLLLHSYSYQIPKIIDSSDTRNVVSIPLIHDSLVPICFRFHHHQSFLNPDPMPLKSPTLYRQRVRCSVPLSRKMAPSSHSVPGP